MKDSLLSLIGKKINNYTITKYIASGAFGNVYEAKNNTGDFFAIKIPIQTEEKNGQKLLLEEYKIYKVLNKNIDKEGIINTKIISSKVLDKKIMIMDLLGESLESMNKHKKFNLKIILLLAIDMIKIIKYIHSCGYIHRDLKPDNFVLSLNSDKLYCVDFGLAKKYIHHNQHIKFKDNLKFCGTARFASISAHKGYLQSRKDDLESIGYILLYLFYGKLWWQGIKHSNKVIRYNLILQKKLELNEEELTKDLPKEFTVYFKYVKNLDYYEEPLYDKIISMFMNLYKSKNYSDTNFDFDNKTVI